MSLHFSANQYQNAFIPHKLASWEVSKDFKERPDIKTAHTTKIVANDRGHLNPSVPKSAQCPWGAYVGTWDLPCHLSGPAATVRTARTTYAQEAMQHHHDNTKWTLDGWAKTCVHSNKAAGRRPPKPGQAQYTPGTFGANGALAAGGAGRTANKKATSRGGEGGGCGGGARLMPTGTCAYQTETCCGGQQQEANWGGDCSARCAAGCACEQTAQWGRGDNGGCGDCRQTAGEKCGSCPTTCGATAANCHQAAAGSSCGAGRGNWGASCDCDSGWAQKTSACNGGCGQNQQEQQKYGVGAGNIVAM